MGNENTLHSYLSLQHKLCDTEADKQKLGVITQKGLSGDLCQYSVPLVQGILQSDRELEKKQQGSVINLKGKQARIGMGEESMTNMATSNEVATIPVVPIANAAATSINAVAVTATDAVDQVMQKDPTASAATIITPVNSADSVAKVATPVGGVYMGGQKNIDNGVIESIEEKEQKLFQLIFDYICQHPQCIEELIAKHAASCNLPISHQQKLIAMMNVVIQLRQTHEQQLARTLAQAVVVKPQKIDSTFVTLAENITPNNFHNENRNEAASKTLETKVDNTDVIEAKKKVTKEQPQLKDDGSYQGRKSSSGPDSLLLKERAALKFVRGAKVKLHSDVIKLARDTLFKQERQKEAQELQQTKGLLTSLENYFNLLEDMSRKLRKDSVKYYRDKAEKGDLGIDDSECLQSTEEALKRLKELEILGFRNANVKNARVQDKDITASAFVVESNDAVLQQQTTTGYRSDDIRHLGAQMLSTISLADNDPSVDPVEGVDAVLNKNDDDAVVDNAVTDTTTTSTAKAIGEIQDLVQGSHDATVVGITPEIDTAASLMDVAMPQMQAVQAVDRLAPAVELGDVAITDINHNANVSRYSVNLNQAPQAMQVVAADTVSIAGNTTTQKEALVSEAAVQGDQVVVDNVLPTENTPLSAFAALDAIEQHFCSQQDSFQIHRAEQWYVVKKNMSLQVGKHSVKLWEPPPVKQLITSMRDLNEITAFAHRSSSVFKGNLPLRQGRQNISVEELVQDQFELMTRRDNDFQINKKMIRKAKEIMASYGKDVDEKEIIMSMPHPTAVGENVCFINLVPHLSLSSAIEASLPKPEQLKVRYQNQNSSQPYAQSQPQMQQQMQPLGQMSQAQAQNQMHADVVGLSADGAIHTVTNTNTNEFTSANTAAAFNQSDIVDVVDDVAEDESYAFDGDVAAQGETWGGIGFSGDDFDEYGDYGGSFSGNMELDLDSALHSEDKTKLVDNAEPIYASDPRTNDKAEPKTTLPIMVNDIEVKAEGLERLTVMDYLPQVAEQDPWYKLILQVFDTEPMVRAVLFNVACEFDPQDPFHWIFYIDRNEELSLLPDIMLCLPQYKDFVHHQEEIADHSGLFWPLIKKRIELALNCNLNVSVQQTEGVPERAPLKLAEFYARQEVEKTKSNLKQVQGLSSLLSMFNEDLQTVDVELYRKRRKEDK